jgi:4-amino-4-deoxy-L-arabinose transferase-like glycosyltransferase
LKNDEQIKADISNFSRVSSLLVNNPVGTTATISILLNLIILFSYLGSPFATFLLWDSANYWDWALRIADGQWISVGVFHQPPLYPYLLALFIKVFGQTLIPVYLLQCVISSATAALLCAITCRVTRSKKTGIVAGLLFTFYGMQVFYTFKILSECIATFLLVLTVLFISAKNTRIRTFAAGLTMGTVLLVKPNFLPAVPFLAVFVLVNNDNRFSPAGLKSMLLFLLACGLAVAPATLMNFITGGEFVLVSANGGENFYLGNNENANGTYVPVEGISSDIAYQNADVVAMARKANKGKTMSRSEVSRYWFQKAVNWITGHPVDYLRLEWKKVLNMFSGVELSNQYLLSFEKKRTTGMFNAAPVNFYMLFPLFCVGCIIVAGNWRRFFPITVFFIANTATMLLFFVDERFRVVTMPFFIAVSAAGLTNILNIEKKNGHIQFSPGRRELIILVTGMLMLAMLYARDRTLPGQEWRMEMAMGDIYYGKGKIDASLDYYVKASSLNKTNSMPALMVSKAMFAKGYKDVAAQLYRNTMSTVSDDVRRTIVRDPDFKQLREYGE